METTTTMPGKLTQNQYDALAAGISVGRVGKNPKGFSHVEAWDVRRWLIRIFGYGGFDIHTKSLDLVREMQLPSTNSSAKPRWTVIYRAEVQLTIKTPNGETIATFEDAAAGDAQNQPSLGDAHDNAMKTALSGALKRCAVNLGDQFGLSLYNGGGTKPVVVSSLISPSDGEETEFYGDEEVKPEPQPQEEKKVYPTIRAIEDELDKAESLTAFERIRKNALVGVAEKAYEAEDIDIMKNLFERAKDRLTPVPEALPA